MNPMANKSPEERKAIAAKSVATRRANREAEALLHERGRQRARLLQQQIAELEEKLSQLQKQEPLHWVSASLTGKVLLREAEIAQAAQPWTKESGVYFLLEDDEVVYVGQAVDVRSRISGHRDKKFNRWAFVACDVGSLDALESLYIHLLRPSQNGSLKNGAKIAPLPLEALFKMAPTDAL